MRLRPSTPPHWLHRVLLPISCSSPPILPGGENGELDNASITRTQQRLYRAVAAINAVWPPPQVRRPKRARKPPPGTAVALLHSALVADHGRQTRCRSRLARHAVALLNCHAVALLNSTRLPSPLQLAVFGGDVVHNGLEHLAQLGLNATGLRRLLAEPVSACPTALPMHPALTAAGMAVLLGAA